MAGHPVRSSPGFGCRVYRDPEIGGVLLEMIGELDLVSAPEVDRTLRAIEAPDTVLIVVHLRGLKFMDVAGLHVLLRACARQRDSGARLIVVPGGEQMTRLFEVTGADERLRLLDRVPTARWMPAPSAQDPSRPVGDVAARDFASRSAA